MNIETTRFRRKFLSFSTSRGANATVLILVCLAYGMLSLSIISSKGNVSPDIVVYLQTALFTILAPALLHGSIAGERERRSWDFLLVAPITHAQIVVGKFLGACAIMLVVVLAGLIPAAIAGLTHDPAYSNLGIFAFVEMEGISITYAMCVFAVTLFFSARVKRPMAALGTVYGLLVVTLLGLPAVLSVGIGSSKVEADTLMFLNPFIAESKLAEPSNISGLPAYLFGLPHVLLYLGLSIVVLAWTSKTLVFAENDVKFLPKGHRGASGN